MRLAEEVVSIDLLPALVGEVQQFLKHPAVVIPVGKRHICSTVLKFEIVQKSKLLNLLRIPVPIRQFRSVKVNTDLTGVVVGVGRWMFLSVSVIPRSVSRRGAINALFREVLDESGLDEDFSRTMF